MERIKQALDKARQERELRQGTSPAPESRPRTSSRTGDIVYDQTQSITVDDAVLRENRIVTALESGPFTDAYKMLRTQVLQRFKEHDWNVLAVTSPGAGEGKTLTAINLAISIARRARGRLYRAAGGCQPPPPLDAGAFRAGTAQGPE